MISGMLERVSVRNFKSLRDASFNLKPITLLIGPNNSGKSSFISLLTTLKQTLMSRSLESPFILEGPYVQLGSYQDVVFAHDITREIGITLSFSREKLGPLFHQRDTSLERGLIELLRFMPLTVSFTIEFDSITETIKLKDLKISQNDKNTLIDIKNKCLVNLLNKKFDTPIELEQATKKPSQTTRLFVNQRHFFWSVLLPHKNDEDMMTEMRLRRLPLVLEQFFEEFVLYLGPLREYPKRFYISSGEKPSDVGLRGEKTVDFLYPKGEKVVDEINYWLKKFDMAESISIERVTPNAGIWKVELTNLRTGISDNLKDVGFGVSQVLPIVTEGLTSKRGTIMLIEQPEIHLHPRAQAELADLFIEIAQQDKTSIIETHSEHMMLRFARRIAEGKLSKDKIVIYEFNSGKTGCNVNEITFDDNGNLEKWPAGFFETDLEETMQHIKAQARKSRENSENGNAGS